MNQPLLNAMNLARDGNWDAAHAIVQNLDSNFAAWIHGYLHRIEGDDANAGYWYDRAGVKFPTDSLNDEWQAIYDSINAQ